MSHEVPPEERDSYVLRLHEQLLEMEQRLIPIGLHVFGEANQNHAADILQAIAGFDRPEMGVRSLPSLIAEGPGLREPQEVAALVREAIAIFLAEGLVPDRAVEFLARTAHVTEQESRNVFALLARVARGLSRNQEVDSLMRALRGEYIEPGPGADIVQNPEILPTGRNTHAVNPYSVPSITAFDRAETVAYALLERYVEEHGRYTGSMALVLWGLDNIETQGKGVAQALWLLGVRPIRDRLNRVS